MRNVEASPTYLSPWTSLYALAGAVIGILGGFLAAPPTNEPATALARFLIAVLIGGALIPATLWKQRSTLRYWAASTGILFLLAIVGIGFYWHDLDRLTRPYGQSRIVIGSHLTAEAKRDQRRLQKIEKSPITDTQLIKESGGLVDTIWPPEEIRQNSELLEIEYVIDAVVFGLLMICLLQSIAIAGVRIPGIQH